MSVEIPAQAIEDARAADGDPVVWTALLALAGPESGWNPDAQGDYKLVRGGPIVSRDTPGAFPTSFGYLQFYTDGGLGDPYSPAQLLDGRTNMQLGADYLRRRLATGATLYDALSPWSTRPAAWDLLQRIQAEGIAGVDWTPPGPDDRFGDDWWKVIAGGVGAGLLLAGLFRRRR